MLLSLYFHSFFYLILISSNFAVTNSNNVQLKEKDTVTFVEEGIMDIADALNKFTEGIIQFLPPVKESEKETRGFDRTMEDFVKNMTTFLSNTVQIVKAIPPQKTLVANLLNKINKVNLKKENTFFGIDEKQTVKLGNDNFVQHFSKLTSVAGHFAAEMVSIFNWLTLIINSSEKSSNFTDEQMNTVRKLLINMYNSLILMGKTIDSILHKLLSRIDSSKPDIRTQTEIFVDQISELKFDINFNKVLLFDIEDYRSEKRNLAILEYFVQRFLETPDKTTWADLELACFDVTTDSMITWLYNVIVNGNTFRHILKSFMKKTGYCYRQYIQLVQLIIGDTYVAQTMYHVCNGVTENNQGLEEIAKTERNLANKINKIIYTLATYEETLQTAFVNDKHFGLAKDVLEIGHSEDSWHSPNITKLLKEKYFFSHFMAYLRYNPLDVAPWRTYAGNYAAMFKNDNNGGFIVVAKQKHSTFSANDRYYFQEIVKLTINEEFNEFWGLYNPKEWEEMASSKRIEKLQECIDWVADRVWTHPQMPQQKKIMAMYETGTEYRVIGVSVNVNKSADVEYYESNNLLYADGQGIIILYVNVKSPCHQDKLYDFVLF